MCAEHNAEATACPTCGQQEFYVSPRDSRVGQCFHCGIQRPFEQTGNVLTDPMFRLYELTHQALFGTPEGDALTAVLGEHGIELEVLLQSMVGVLPVKLEATAFFEEATRDAQTAIQSLAASKPTGRPSNAYLAAKAEAESRLATLRRVEEEIATAVRESAGSLVCFCTDAAHNIVGCRVLPPDGQEDNARWIAGASSTRQGLFNHGLFGRTRYSGLMPGPDDLLLVNDCRSVLQIQSALYRAAKTRGESGRDGYGWVAALAGVIDADVVRATHRTPVLCYPPTPEGTALIEVLRERVTLTAFVGPADTSIGDAVVRQDDESGLEELARNIGEAELFTRPFRAVRAEIDDVRRLEGRGLKKFECDRWASDIVGRDLSERGRLYHDGRVGYVLLLDTKEVVPFDPDNDEYRLLMDRYGINARDTVFKPMLEHLDMRARKYGTQTEVHTSSHFDRERFVCYLFNNADTVYRITARGVEAVANGTNAVLFVRDPKRQPWALMSTGSGGVDLAATLLGQIHLGESALKAWAAWFLILVWFYSLFFRPLFPTRVILALVGEKGSGKTTLLKRIGRLILGSKFEVTDISEDAKDLDAALTGQPFVVIDNADRAMPWLDDKLAIAATGGSIKRRILYTTNKLAEFPIVAWVGITSRTPHFRREDVADRLLLINVERFDSFMSANHLDDDIERHRDALMTEVIWTLQNIVTELQRQTNLQVETTFRMADFAEFAVKIGPVLGVNGKEVEQILRDLATVQLEFTSVDEPLLLHLDGWLANATNISKWVATKELFEQLHARWHVSRAGTFPWRDPRQLGQHITSLRSTLETHYDFEERTARAGARRVRFNKQRSGDDGAINIPSSFFASGPQKGNSAGVQ
jgi:hypothetical protein